MKSLMLGGLSLLLLSATGLPVVQAADASPAGPTIQTKQAGVALRTLIRQSEPLYLSPGESHDYTLRLDASATVDGRTYPAGSIVRGSFEPITGGLQYIATSIEVGDRIYTLNAASAVLHDQKDPRETTTGAILGDAAIGAAGGLVLGEVLGDADVWEIIGGAAAGAVVGNVTAPQVVVIEPDQPITLTTR
jgi:hypothetical protein